VNGRPAKEFPVLVDLIALVVSTIFWTATTKRPPRQIVLAEDRLLDTVPRQDGAQTLLYTIDFAHRAAGRHRERAETSLVQAGREPIDQG
jgi:hypothetical protein